MKLKIIDAKHGPDSKAWYTLKPLKEKYLDENGIPTMWGLGVGNYERCLTIDFINAQSGPQMPCSYAKILESLKIT